MQRYLESNLRVLNHITSNPLSTPYSDPDSSTKITSEYDATTGIAIYNTEVSPWQSTVAVQATADQYRAFQEMGITGAIEGSPSSKIFACLGDYRRQVAETREKLGVESKLADVKESICQYAFSRTRALQIMERAYGGSTRELEAAYASYRTMLEAALDAGLGGLHNTNYNSPNIRPYIKGRIKVCLESDEMKSLSAEEKEVKRLYLEALADDYLNVPKIPQNIQSTPTGNNRSRDFIADFVKSRANAILTTAEKSNDLITLSGARFIGRGAFFRGALMDAIVNAVDAVRNYTFSDKAILPAHQGVYDSALNATEASTSTPKITLLSSQLVGTRREGIERFLFVANKLLTPNKSSRDKSSRDLAKIKKMSNTSHWRWLRRLFPWGTPQSHAKYVVKRWTRSKVADPIIGTSLQRYYWLLSKVREAQLSQWSVFKRDAMQFSVALGKSIYYVFKISASNFKEVLGEAIDDIRWNKSPPPAKADPHALKPEERHLAKQVEHYEPHHRAYLKAQAAKQQSVTISRNEGSPPKNPVITATVDDIAKFIQTQRQLFERGRLTAPLAGAPYSLASFESQDPMSKLVGAAESMFGLFAPFYAKSPTVALLATAAYAGSATAIASPALLSQISPALDPVKVWSLVTGQAMSSSMDSQMIAAGFTNFKEVLLALQFAADGSNSGLAHLLQGLKTHWPEALVAAALLTAAGVGLSYVTLPVIGSEEGTVPALTDALVAAKFGLIAGELLYSERGEPSFAARMITALLRFVMLTLRLAFMPFNLIINKWIIGSFYSNGLSYTQVFRPLVDLALATKSISLRLADSFLRLLNLLGMSLKIVPKVLIDALVNNLATVFNHFQMVLAMAAMVLVGVFVLQFSWLPIVGLAVAVGFVMQALSWAAMINLRIPKVSAGLIVGKHAVYGFFDSYFSRPIKQFYEFMRRRIADELMESKKRFDSYHLAGKIARGVGLHVDTLRQMAADQPLPRESARSSPIARHRAPSRAWEASVPVSASAHVPTSVPAPAPASALVAAALVAVSSLDAVVPRSGSGDFGRVGVAAEASETGPHHRAAEKVLRKASPKKPRGAAVAARLSSSKRANVRLPVEASGAEIGVAAAASAAGAAAGAGAIDSRHRPRKTTHGRNSLTESRRRLTGAEVASARPLSMSAALGAYRGPGAFAGGVRVPVVGRHSRTSVVGGHGMVNPLRTVAPAGPLSKVAEVVESAGSSARAPS